MIEYLEEITTHSYHATHQELEKKIAEVESTLEDLPEDARFYLERLHDINVYVKHRINSVDPMFLPKSQLEAFDRYARKQIDQIDAYLSNNPLRQTVYRTSERAIEYLVNANNSADQSLVQLGSIPYPQTSGDVEQMKENIVTFRRSVGQHVRNVEGEFSKIQEGLKSAEKSMQKVVTTVDAQKQRVDAIVVDYQKQFSSGEDIRREGFTSAEEKRANLFSEAELKRQQSFDREFVNQKIELDEIVKSAASNSSLMSERFQEQAIEVLMRLDEYKRDAEILVGVIGSKGIIHGYQSVANEEVKTARRWEKFAVGSMGVLVFFGLYAFWLAHSENFNWHFLAARAMAVIPLGVFAAYAAHKAEQHRQIERNSRRMELELAAINPYLATLPNETQYEVKRLLAERYFANDGNKVEIAKLPEQTASPSELLKPVLENLKLVLESITKK